MMSIIDDLSELSRKADEIINSPLERKADFIESTKKKIDDILSCRSLEELQSGTEAPEYDFVYSFPRAPIEETRVHLHSNNNSLSNNNSNIEDIPELSGVKTVFNSEKVSNSLDSWKNNDHINALNFTNHVENSRLIEKPFDLEIDLKANPPEPDGNKIPKCSEKFLMINRVRSVRTSVEISTNSMNFNKFTDSNYVFQEYKHFDIKEEIEEDSDNLFSMKTVTVSTVVQTSLYHENNVNKKVLNANFNEGSTEENSAMSVLQEEPSLTESSLDGIMFPDELMNSICIDDSFSLPSDKKELDIIKIPMNANDKLDILHESTEENKLQSEDTEKEMFLNTFTVNVKVAPSEEYSAENDIYNPNSITLKNHFPRATGLSESDQNDVFPRHLNGNKLQAEGGKEESILNLPSTTFKATPTDNSSYENDIYNVDSITLNSNFSQSPHLEESDQLAVFPETPKKGKAQSVNVRKDVFLNLLSVSRKVTPTEKYSDKNDNSNPDDITLNNNLSPSSGLSESLEEGNKLCVVNDQHHELQSQHFSSVLKETAGSTADVNYQSTPHLPDKTLHKNLRNKKSHNADFYTFNEAGKKLSKKHHRAEKATPYAVKFKSFVTNSLPAKTAANEKKRIREEKSKRLKLRKEKLEIDRKEKIRVSEERRIRRFEHHEARLKKKIEEAKNRAQNKRLLRSQRSSESKSDSKHSGEVSKLDRTYVTQSGDQELPPVYGNNLKNDPKLSMQPRVVLKSIENKMKFRSHGVTYSAISKSALEGKISVPEYPKLRPRVLLHAIDSTTKKKSPLSIKRNGQPSELHSNIQKKFNLTPICEKITDPKLSILKPLVILKDICKTTTNSSPNTGKQGKEIEKSKKREKRKATNSEISSDIFKGIKFAKYEKSPMLVPKSSILKSRVLIENIRRKVTKELEKCNKENLPVGKKTTRKRKPANCQFPISRKVVSKPDNKMSQNAENKRKAKAKLVSSKLSDISSYEISDINEDSLNETPDTSIIIKRIPRWAKGIHLKQALFKQHYDTINGDEIFGDCLLQKEIKLADIFKIDKPRYHLRTSSAIWSSNNSPE